MNVAIYVALGSAFGAPARFLVDQYFRKYTEKPIGTFFVNVIGSFFIGLTFAAAEDWHHFIAVGFAGSFTTWSTFMLDLYLAIRMKKYNPAIINFIASIAFGLCAAWLGVSLVN